MRRGRGSGWGSAAPKHKFPVHTTQNVSNTPEINCRGEGGITT